MCDPGTADDAERERIGGRDGCMRDDPGAGDEMPSGIAVAQHGGDDDRERKRREGGEQSEGRISDAGWCVGADWGWRAGHDAGLARLSCGMMNVRCGLGFGQPYLVIRAKAGVSLMTREWRHRVQSQPRWEDVCGE